jgi:hypothetical protein
MPNKNHSSRSCDDPLVSHSLREAKWIVVIWLVTFIWVVGYCARFGYHEAGTAVPTIFGMPSWVFWGVALPWAAATVVSSWFALFQIADDSLVGDPPAGDPPAGDPRVDDANVERSENGR